MAEECYITFDPNKIGVSEGHLVIPKGNNEEPLRLRVVSHNRGDGPRVLITAGSHGNEGEGPIVARRALEWLPSLQRAGRVIVVPALNSSALEGWSRQSPLDGLDLNRIFPGRAAGSISERIADAVVRLLLPLADVVFDLHSNGPKWGGVPASTFYPIADAHLMLRTLRIAESFLLPATMVWDGEDPGMFDSVAVKQGKVFVCGELGAGLITPGSLAIAEAGVRNALIGLGIVDGRAEPPTFLQKKQSQTYRTLSSDYLCSPRRGVFEPRCSVLEHVSEGNVVGVVHPLDLSASGSIEIRSPITAVVCNVRTSMVVECNDRVVVLGRPG